MTNDEWQMTNEKGPHGAPLSFVICHQSSPEVIPRITSRLWKMLNRSR